MRRDLASLSAAAYDVVVVGGGIHGACAAWEVARRKLTVALVEAGDFNQATSANSLRTLHGGLRHLQRLDFVHMRESIRERREWLRLAPGLTRPLRFVLPAGRGTKSRTVLGAALRLNDLVSADRNNGVGTEHRLPGGAMLGRREFESLFPGLSVTGCTGAAAWYDGVCLDTERLQLAVVAAAAASGARVANYLRALRPLTDGHNVRGVRVRDELGGREMELHAQLVINATGPWVQEWPQDPARHPASQTTFRPSKAFNLLVRALPFTDALGLSTPSGTYFIMPWNGYSLIGTRHLCCDPAERTAQIKGSEVLEFLAELNPLLGTHRLTAHDIRGVFSGLLPEAQDAHGPHVSLERAPRIVEHTEPGLRGLLSIVGVKWTTARAVGERAARTACRRLGRPDQQLAGPRALTTASPVATRTDATALADRVVPDLPVMFWQIVHAVRHEMAVRLSDVVRRRTPLYLSAALERSVLAACAEVMARELRWTQRETEAEINAAEAELAAFRGPLQSSLAEGTQRGSPQPSERGEHDTDCGRHQRAIGDRLCKLGVM